MENLQKFYINGEWVNPLSDATMAVLNPATEQQIGLVALGNDADVDRAVAAANAAFEGFSQTSKDERLALLGRVLAATLGSLGGGILVQLSRIFDFLCSWVTLAVPGIQLVGIFRCNSSAFSTSLSSWCRSGAFWEVLAATLGSLGRGILVQQSCIFNL